MKNWNRRVIEFPFLQAIEVDFWIVDLHILQNQRFIRQSLLLRQSMAWRRAAIGHGVVLVRFDGMRIPFWSRSQCFFSISIIGEAPPLAMGNNAGDWSASSGGRERGWDVGVWGALAITVAVGQRPRSSCVFVVGYSTQDWSKRHQWPYLPVDIRLCQRVTLCFLLTRY